MSNQGDDCYYFFYSTCTKGDSCTFRHCEAAIGNETVCNLWQEGRCFRQICKFRHMEIDKKRSEIPCYWENQMTGCQKANCAFHHTKGRFVEGSYFPPNKAISKPEPCEAEVQTSLKSPALAKISAAPTPQLRGVKKIEATENVPSPTHPPVVINAADDDEDDDDQFSEEGEEMKNSANLVSTRKSLTPKKDAALNYGIKTLEEIKSEKQKCQDVSNNVPQEIQISSHNRVDHCISVLRTVKFTSKDSSTNLSLSQRLGKRRKFQGESPLAASDEDILPPAKKTLSERLGKRFTPTADDPEFQPKKGIPIQISRPLKDRLGLVPEQGGRQTERAAATTVTDFHIKTLEEIRQEKANQQEERQTTSLPLKNDEVCIKSKLSSNPSTAIYIKSLNEIQAEKRLRHLKDGLQKQGNTKEKELQQKNYGTTVQNCTATIENAKGLNRKIQVDRKIKRPIVNDNCSGIAVTTTTLSVNFKDPKQNLPSMEKVKVKTLEEIREEKALRSQQSTSQPVALSHSKKILRLAKLPDKPKLNVEPSVVKNTIHIKAARKQKTQERTIIAEVKPMSSAVTSSEALERLPVPESSEEVSMDIIPPKRLQISSQVNTPLSNASVTIPATLKSPRTSTASVGKTSLSTEDEFDELMWEISDDKLDAELDLDSNKDEDALLLELSKMIDG
ncbi:zinc finger CCCH domain-containing protein 11A isoform X4 [Engystomops pustulosus]|uniref:zinc finger CCCH domain-containing protein 11A isoform X4 n=1 Tax=Engystomops pustulosus TaxID=76066 RepID=UPI003AFA61FF